MAANTSTLTNQGFNDLQGDFCKGDISVRLIHSWEARNFRNGNSLMGVEVLLIDSKGFIPANRLYRFQGKLKPGSIYRLSNFSIRPAKRVYRVTANPLGVTFTDQTSFVELEDSKVEMPKQKFRIHNFQTFENIADTATDLYDIIGHIRLINGANLEALSNLPTPPAGGSTEERVDLHVLLEDGETVRVYLWGRIATAFRERWNESEEKPKVILITTVNPKTLGSAVALGSTAATRLFFDRDLEDTSNYMARFANGDQAIPRVTSSTSAITKLETVTLDEIHSFVATENPQVASFMCYATITDVLGEYGWFFVACSGCRSKMTTAITTLQCVNPKCSKETKVGLIRYVNPLRYAHKMIEFMDTETGIPVPCRGACPGQQWRVANFVFFDTEVEKFIGRKAADLMTEIRQGSETLLTDHEPIPAPACLENMVGHCEKFQVKVDKYTFKAARKTITVSRIVKDGTTNVKGAEEDEETVALKDRDGTISGSEVGRVEVPGTGETEKKDGKRPRYN